MENRFLPSYTIGPDAYDEIPAVCRKFGKTAVIIGGNQSRAAAEPLIRLAVKGEIEITGSFLYGDDATFENGDRLTEIPEVKAADMIFAVGGGRACDTAKYAAEKLDKPIFTFPTLASNCASITAVCIMYYPDHTYRANWYRSRPPFHTFINTDVVLHSPRDYFWAGIGDALSKEYEVLFNARGDKLDYFQSIGARLAGNCSDGLLEKGEEALLDFDKGMDSEAFRFVVQNIIISTGLISNCVPVIYNSSLAHAIYNSHGQVPHRGNHLHGAVVCYGTLVLLTLDGQKEERDRMLAFTKKTNLPHSLADIGVDRKDAEALSGYALEKPDIRHVPYEIRKEAILKAMDELEGLK
ncbi:iron-containing alcohol dehydrogenase family protein [uncultured Dialister sp.]|uniref:iron-containing alcohol dehydrogenase family protein n=1 Tax=uncultured Dialister sp. TaxID=278064 RepID=UPI002617D962|nr:iron-containing alcohol dehydrogenase family protein [uncultured Dialister sp.]